MLLYRGIALMLAVAFAAVGLAFLLAPGMVRAVIDQAAQAVGMQGMPAGDAQSGLFRALAVAYMYVVTLLAWIMFRRPAEPVWAGLLAHAKLASAAISFLLIVLNGAYFAYVANGVVDGAIGVAALVLRGLATGRQGRSTAGGPRR
jgi:hypothetical protein